MPFRPGTQRRARGGSGGMSAAGGWLTDPANLRNIPHADGSRECHPVARAAADPVDAALARYEEAKRWRAEAKAGIDRAVHDFGVALVKEEQARVRYFDALDGREAG